MSNRSSEADSNPFFHRGPVRDPSHFFGRSQEVAYLFDLLSRGQSISISGPRRIGKTSLVFYATNLAVSYQFDPEPSHTQWVYVDGGMLDGLGEEWLYGAIDRGLGSDIETLAYRDLVERLRALSAEDTRLIVTLDEFELIAANPQLQPSVFNRLKGLAAQYAIQFVVASKEPLARLSLSSEFVSSPFFNIFAPLRLGLFQDQEAAAMLATLSERGGQAFAPETIAFLLDLVGPHPLFLQVVGYRAFAVQHDGQLEPDAREALRQQALTDLDQHLRYYWSGLSDEQQYLLASLPLMAAGGHSSALAQLSDSGLLYQNDYLGAVQRDFVRGQLIEGVLNYGPFSIDVRLKLVMVNDQPIDLTPTEFAALRLFLQNPGKLITPDDIEAALWPTEIAPDPERARGVVKKLRGALGDAGERIANRRGQGYLLSLD